MKFRESKFRLFLLGKSRGQRIVIFRASDRAIGVRDIGTYFLDGRISSPGYWQLGHLNGEEITLDSARKLTSNLPNYL